MPRPPLPNDVAMARQLAIWLRETQLSPERVPLLESEDWRQAYPGETDPNVRLKTEYLGLQALTWLLAHGQPVTLEEIHQLLSTTKVRAGNSRDKQLWRSRVVQLHPQSTYLRLPPQMPAWVMGDAIAATHLASLLASPSKAELVRMADPSPLLVTLANKPSILIDRATRSVSGWNDKTLQYTDIQGDLTLNYFEENAGPDTLRQQLMTLDPRTSDVWRLLTAKALENDRDDLFAPITVKPEELARALGLKPHPKGGMRQKDLVHCTQSLFHLERLWLIMPDAKDSDEATRERVLAVMKRGRGRKVEGQVIPSSWTVVLGEWARYFPKSYAPIFRSLVELPANSATNLWAKQIGTEVTYWLRETAEDTNQVRRIQVQALLARASILGDVVEMRANRNLNRAIERFEGTLDLLRTLGVHEGWSYDARSVEQLDRQQGRATFFETWMSSALELKVPQLLLHALVELAEQTPTSLPNSINT